MPNCPNCNYKLQARFQYCPSCGEELNRHVFTFKHLFAEILEGFTHFDLKIFQYVKLLFSKPWFIVYEYLHGKKKKYFNPFVAFVLAAGLFVLIFHVYMKALDHEIIVQIKSLKANPPISSDTQEVIAMMESSMKMNHALLQVNKYFHVLNLFIYALPIWLCFYLFLKKPYNYVETVFAMMVLWTTVLLIYCITTGFDYLGMKFHFQHTYDHWISVLIAFFVGHQCYKLLQLEKQRYWIFIFAVLFYLIDDMLISRLIHWVGKLLIA